MTRRCLRLLSLIAASLAGAVPAVTAESLVDTVPHFCQVRTTDYRIAAAVERGLRDSPTFRELVNRINISDVVVYVTVDQSALPPGLDGRLTFVSSTGGFRYVLVRLSANLSLPRLVSLLAHELQHAREIADSDTIVDATSMAREYATRLGYHNGRTGDRHNTFDSMAAVEAGERVLKEILAE